MSSTAVLDRIPASPESIPIDFDGVLSPRCPKTGRTMRERDEVSTRHFRHRSVSVRKELARKQRGKTDLSEAQHRMLFDSTLDPGAVLDTVKGHKYTKRQHAQIKVLKKLRSSATEDVPAV